LLILFKLFSVLTICLVIRLGGGADVDDDDDDDDDDEASGDIIVLVRLGGDAEEFEDVE
jgi:hypothetical protein